MSAEATVEPRSRAPVLVRERAWPLVVWTAMIGWSLALFAVVRNDYYEFRLGRFDLGNMVQAVWSTAHARPLEITDASGEQIVRLGSHVDPILVLLSPFWLLAPTPLTLAAVQVAACALGALPVLWLGRRHLGSERAASLMALAYLAYPWLAWTAVDAFHPVTVAIPLFLYAIWFLDSGRIWAFTVCALLILATGELMGLPLAALGLWYWLARGRRRPGLAIAGAGVAYTLLAIKVIVPGFRGEESPFYDRFASVGGSPEGVLRTAVTDPLTIVGELASRDDLWYLLWLGWPLAFLFLLAPGLMAVAMPQFLINGLSDWETTTDPRHHYVAAVVPFLVAASVLALVRLPQARRTTAAAAVLTVSLTLTVLTGPWPETPGTRQPGFHARLPATHVNALRDAVARVPDGVAVSTTNLAGSQLSARQYVFSVPIVRRANWIVIDSWDTWMPPSPSREEGLHPAELRRFLDHINSSAEWRRTYRRHGVFVFTRVPR